jgi:hypothetical protein
MALTFTAPAALSTTSPRVTPEMVRYRTVELARNAGRSSTEISQLDYEQAKRELTGETDFDLQHAMLYPEL